MQINPGSLIDDDILIVDDMKTNLELLMSILQEAGFKVRPASDGEMALRSAKAKPPALVLLDIKLPGIDGYEVCRRLKSHETTRLVPVIFISILEDDISKVRGFQAGGVDFINKPFYAEEVLARVRTHIMLRQMQTDLENRNARLITGMSEQKRVEEALRISEEQFRAIFENNSAAIAIIEMDTTISMVNEAYCQMSGYSKDEVIGMSWTKQIHPDDLERLKEYNRKRLINPPDAPGKYEFKFFKKNGEIRYGLMSVSLIEGNRRIITSFTDITERMRAEVDLVMAKERAEVSEQRFRSLFENMIEGFAYCKMLFEDGLPVDFIYIEVNDAFEPLTGLKDVTGKRVSEVIPGIRHSDTELFQIYGRVAMTGKPERFEMFIESLNDWYSISVYSPQQGYFVAVFDVITKRKQTEKMLRESEERLHLAQSAAKAGTWEWKLDTNINIWSEELWQLYGLEPGSCEASYETWLQSIVPEDRKRVEQTVQEAAKNGSELNTEWRVQNNDGEVRWLMSRGKPMKDANGRVDRYLGIVIDVTELKWAEESLRESEDRFEKFMANLPAVVFIKDRNSRLLFANSVLVNLFGWQEAVGKLTDELLPPEQARKMMNDDKRIIEEGPEIIHEKVTDINGTEHFFETHKFPFYKKNEDVLLGGISIDETERRLAEEKLVQLNNQLKELNTTKDKLFSIIAHDLRSPVTSIFGLAEVLGENIQKGNTEKSGKIIGQMISAAKHVLVLLDNLLTWARTQTGQISFNPENIRLQPIIQEIVDALRISATNKNISFNCFQSDDIVVYADPNMLQVILRNLIANAIKFTHIGGRIDIYSIAYGHEIEITVEDNGVGMSRETRKELFNLDLTLTTPGTLNEKGSGLGLFLCKEFIDKHGGKIWVESKLGKGSKFCFTIPQV